MLGSGCKLAAAHRCSPSCCSSPPQDAKRGFSAAAVFIARNRFALLDKSGNQLIIKDLANEVGGVAWASMEFDG
jgi:hypothetical protein